MDIGMNTTSGAVARSRWLAELAQALDRAATLTVELIDRHGDGGEAVRLQTRIRLLRGEIDSLRRGRPEGPWSSHSDWQ